jgi:glycosyltransferase involved in cell wall biosynthesis
MRILHLVPAIFGTDSIVGGAERYALELAKHMAEEASTTLAAFGDKEQSYQIGCLNVRVLGPSWYVRGQRANPLAASLLDEIRKVEIVHCHQQHIVASSFASLVCRLTGRKVYVSDLGGGGWDVSSYCSTDRWYHGHLHISEYSRGIFGHANNPRAHVIYGGVDIVKFSPDTSVLKDGTVLFVGRLLPHKGIDDLINAVPLDMKLEIIGRPYDPRYFGDLMKLAEGKRVTFRHECDDNSLVQAYRRALCIVLPSVYRTMYHTETNIPELLGQTLLEGMACGIPAICTNVASMPEVVTDQVTGYVVAPSNPDILRERLLRLSSHASEAQEMGAAARRCVIERFTWRSVVNRCLQIYAT